ncbi:phasin family protein [Altererythrobacter sp. CAU 1778]
MADATADKTLEASEKAFAEAAEKSVSEKAVAQAVQADKPKPEVKPAEVAKAVAAKAPAPAKAPAKKAVAKKAPAKKPAPKAKTLPAKSKASDLTIPSLKKPAQPAEPKTTLTELKETIMAKTQTNTVADTMKTAMSELQTRAKTAYEKSTALTGEMVEFSKGNVEAMVESGKVLGTGMQDMGKSYVEEMKGAYSTVTGDMKEMAAVKSPTELFQLQSKIARRNFDNAIAFGSKNTEMMVKLFNDAFAPISSRVSVASEKLSKAA